MKTFLKQSDIKKNDYKYVDNIYFNNRHAVLYDLV